MRDVYILCFSPSRCFSQASGPGTSEGAARVAIVCNRETIAPTIAPTLHHRRTKPDDRAIVGAIVGSLLRNIATVAGAPLVPGPLARLRFRMFHDMELLKITL